MELINNIVYEIKYLTICVILDIREISISNVTKTHYPLGGEAGGQVGSFLYYYVFVPWKSNINT